MMSKLGLIGAFVALTGALTAAAPLAQKSSTRVVVEDGDEMTLTGCVAKTPEGLFSLTNAAGKKGAVGTYLLAVTDQDQDLDDVEKHLGHRVEIEGKAADKGKGKLKVFTKNEAPKADGGKARTETKSEVTGDLGGLPFLGVKSIRMLASVCP